jgi:hypothetical protein
MCATVSCLVMEEHLVKSNQVCAKMKIEISDFQRTIQKNVLYGHKDFDLTLLDIPP